MSEERLLILKMLEEGKIRVEEAERLLSALGSEKSSKGPTEWSQFFEGIEEFFQNFGKNFENLLRDFPEFLTSDTQEVTSPVETQYFETGEAAELQMTHRHGSVTIEAWDAPGIQVEFMKKAWAKTSEEASAILDAIRLISDANDRCVTLRTEYPEDQGLWRGKRRAAVEYTIHVPRKTQGDLDLRHATLMLRGVHGPVRLQTQHGDIQVMGIEESLEIEGAHGNVQVTHVKGPVTVKRRHGNLVLRDVGAPLTVQGEHGNITLEGVRGDIVLRRAHGRVDVRELVGNFEIQHRHGHIRLQGRLPEGMSQAELTHASIHLVLQDPPPVYLEASTHHGRIESEFEGQFTDQRLGQELRAGDPSAPLKLRLTAHHGNIRVEKRGESHE